MRENTNRGERAALSKSFILKSQQIMWVWRRKWKTEKKGIAAEASAGKTVIIFHLNLAISPLCRLQSLIIKAVAIEIFPLIFDIQPKWTGKKTLKSRKKMSFKIIFGPIRVNLINRKGLHWRIELLYSEAYSTAVPDFSSTADNKPFSTGA